jgi:hypothetical protein
MNKKGLTAIQVIILLVLGLLAIGVVSYMLVNTSQKTNTGLLGCESKGGVCMEEFETCDGSVSRVWTCGPKSKVKDGKCCFLDEEEEINLV